MKIKFTKNWKYAEHGVHVLEFTAEQVLEVSDACGRQALIEGVAEPVKPGKAEKTPVEENSAAGESGDPETSGTETPVSSLPPAPASRGNKLTSSARKPAAKKTA